MKASKFPNPNRENTIIAQPFGTSSKPRKYLNINKVSANFIDSLYVPIERTLFCISISRFEKFKFLILIVLSIMNGFSVFAQTVSTLANVRASGDIAVANNGDIYITDFGNPSLQNGTTVVKITAEGNDSVFVSNLANAPSGIVIDSSGTIFVATYNGGIIYSVSEDGVVTQIATANGPVGLALDDQQNLYVAECNINRISRIDNGSLVTIANGQGMACPNGLVKGHDGAMYTVNFDNGGMYRVTLNGQVSLFATIPGGGNGHVEYYDGKYYVTARNAHQIYQVDTSGNVSLLAGTGSDGNLDGDSLSATFSRPNGLGLSPDGSNLYVTGNSNFSAPTLAIRKIELAQVSQEDAISINNGLSGTWYNSETPGQGFLFDINDDSKLFFGGWFTYNNSGTSKSIGAPEHRWYSIQGLFDEKTAQIPIFNSTGGFFDDPTETQSDEVGQFTATFSSCNQGTIEYQFNVGNNNVSGGFDITRLTPDSFCQEIIDSNPTDPQERVKITYIGNEGVFISDGLEGFLVDAIGSFGGFFIDVPTSLQNTILDLQPPYDQTIAVLVTHGHSDHYNITPVRNFINSSNAQLFIDSQSRPNFTSLGNNVENINLNRFSADSRVIGNTKITTIATRHFNQFGNDFSSVENFSYLIEISGKRILHLGDFDYANDNFQAIISAINGEVDAVILATFNDLVNQQNASLVAQSFPNATIIASHLRAGNASDINAINTFYPDAVIFDQPLESIEL